MVWATVREEVVGNRRGDGRRSRSAEENAGGGRAVVCRAVRLDAFSGARARSSDRRYDQGRRTGTVTVDMGGFRHPDSRGCRHVDQ